MISPFTVIYVHMCLPVATILDRAFGSNAEKNACTPCMGAFLVKWAEERERIFGALALKKLSFENQLRRSFLEIDRDRDREIER